MFILKHPHSPRLPPSAHRLRSFKNQLPPSLYISSFSSQTIVFVAFIISSPSHFSTELFFPPFSFRPSASHLSPCCLFFPSQKCHHIAFSLLKRLLSFWLSIFVFSNLCPLLISTCLCLFSLSTSFLSR